MGDIITNAIPVYKGEGTLSPWNQPNPLHAKTHLSLGCRICHWQRIESGTPSNDDPTLADLYPSMPQRTEGDLIDVFIGVFWNKILEFVTEDLNNSMRQFVIKMLICLDPSAILHPSEGNSIKIYKIRSNCLWYQPFDA